MSAPYEGVRIHSTFWYLEICAGLAGVYAHNRRQNEYIITSWASLYLVLSLLVEQHLEVSLAVAPAVVLMPRSLQLWLG